MKIAKWLGGALFSLCCSVSAFAGDVPTESCNDGDAVDKRIVFVNGINVEDRYAARDSMHRMKAILCDTTDTGTYIVAPGSVNHRPVMKNFSFDLVYNPTGWSTLPNDTTESTLSQDVKELFMLKTHEENIQDDLNLLRQHGPYRGLLSDVDYQAAAHRVTIYAQNIAHNTTSLEQEPSVINGSETYCDPEAGGRCTTVNSLRPLVASDMTPTQNAISSLATEIAAGQVLLVAHSEGNLLAQLAYAKAIDTEVSRRDAVRIVNVANTAAMSMNDFVMSTDSDEALAALTNIAFPSWKRVTAKHPDYGVYQTDHDPYTLGNASGWSTCDLADKFLDHYLTCSYLSGDRTADVTDYRGVNFTPGASSLAARFEDLVYAAADSLDDAQAGWLTQFRDDFDSSTPTSNWTVAGFTTKLQVDGTMYYTDISAAVGQGIVRMSSYYTAPTTLRMKFRRKLTGGTGSYFLTRAYLNGSTGFVLYTSTPGNWGTWTSFGYTYLKDASTGGGVGYDPQWNYHIGDWVNYEYIITEGCADVYIWKTSDTNKRKLSFCSSGIHPTAMPRFTLASDDGLGEMLLDYVSIQTK